MKNTRGPKDTNTISNAAHEIARAARTCGVPVYVVHLAKHVTKSNDRKVVYDWVEANKDAVTNAIDNLTKTNDNV
jgi:uncharacterized protein YaiI (UPF0178 family)